MSIQESAIGKATEARVVVVSDQRDRLEQVGLLLGEAGYRVLRAGGGSEGFEITRQEHPDLVISDVSMPRPDGIEMCRLIRDHAELRYTPVLLLSGSQEENHHLAVAMKAGADDFLEAPHEPLCLIAKVAQLVERNRTEEALRESQARLVGITNSAMDAIITVDDNHRIVLFNTAAENMFRCSSDQTIGQPLDRFIPERFRKTHSSHIRSFGDTGITTRAIAVARSVYGLRADGEEFPVEAAISQLESGGRKLYTVILRDITERRRAEMVLKEQAQILDLVPVIIRDLSNRVIFWNSGAEQMYGLTSAEARGQIIHNLLHTEFPQLLDEIETRFSSNGHWEGELVQSRKDGGRIVVVSHWVLHRDALGEPRAILEVNNDITERKEAEREVRRLNQELEQRVTDRTAQLQAANKELEAFSYSVSHDLRAPLRHINGFSQALLEDYGEQLDEVGKGYLRSVRGASKEMAHLIDDLLELARVTRSEMHRELVNLSEMARQIVAELQARDVGRKAAVDIEEDLSTQGDKRLLQIMMNNLIENAWKFTAKRDQARIAFGREEKDGEVLYFVRDNGAGFDMAYVNKLFGAFQRLHGSVEFEGTGIGLATVQRIVNRHRGRVWAEGATDLGATFYFALPDRKETENGEHGDPAGGR